MNPIGGYVARVDRWEHAKDTQTTLNASAASRQAELKWKKAWEAAIAPSKGIPMNLFMLWMAGNGVQIFSLMITGMLMFNAIKAILSAQQVFRPYASSPLKAGDRSLLMPQFTFILLQLVLFAMGLYKCQAMGLLPTADSDWVAFLQPPTSQEKKLW